MTFDINALARKAQRDLTLDHADALAVVQEWLSRCQNLHQQYPHLASVNPDHIVPALMSGSMDFVFSPTGVKVVRA